MVFYQTEFALRLIAERASLQCGRLVRIVHLLAELARHVGEVSCSLLLGVEGFECSREDGLVAWIEPPLLAPFVEALEFLSLFEPVFVLDEIATLEKKHFDSAVRVDFLHFFVNFE